MSAAFILDKLRNGRAEDVHGVRAEYLKWLCYQHRAPGGMLVREYALCPHLVHIFNRCLQAGQLPHSLCHGRVCLLHKSGDGLVHDNYRLITIEPLLAKLYAIVLEQRAARYLEQCGLRALNRQGSAACILVLTSCSHLTT
jgi:hypothetical protein